MSLNIAQQFMKVMVKNYFGLLKIEILTKLKPRGFLASSLSTYDFFTLYTTPPHNLIKEKLTELIEQTFNRVGSLYSVCNDKNAFFTSEQPKRYKWWSCQKMCDALYSVLDNIFIRVDLKLNPWICSQTRICCQTNVSGNRCESDCRSRGREFDPRPVPYFRGD